MLEGIIRDSITKKATKQLRKDDYLIANIYGKASENLNVAFKTNAFIKFMKTKESIAFEVTVAGTTYKVVVKEYQKCPLTSTLIHVDLMLALPGIRSVYHVPVTTEGHPVGVKNKGLFVFHKNRIPVKTTIEQLPEVFHLKVSDLDVGDNILIRDIDFVDGVDCYLDPRVPIVGVIKAK